MLFSVPTSVFLLAVLNHFGRVYNTHTHFLRFKTEIKEEEQRTQSVCVFHKHLLKELKLNSCVLFFGVGGR